MKRIMLAVVVLCGALGCEKRPPTQEEKAISASRALIAALATNASVRVIMESDAVRVNLTNVKEKSERDALIADWRSALKSIPVKGLRPSDRYVAVREACHLLVWHPYFDGDRCHSRANGAGVWHHVIVGNRVDATDTAAYAQSYPRMTQSGEITDDVTVNWLAGENVWSVPFGWNVSGTSGKAEPRKCFAADETQVFTIDQFGTAGVCKLRHEAVREAVGPVYLDGVRVW